MFVRQAFRPATRAFAKSFTRSNFTQQINTQNTYSKYLIGGGLLGVGATLWFAKDYFSAEEANVALSTTEYRSFPIANIIQANHNSNFYVVKLPEDSTAGLTTASFVMIKGKDKDGKEAVGIQIKFHYFPEIYFFIFFVFLFRLVGKTIHPSIPC